MPTTVFGSDSNQGWGVGGGLGKETMLILIATKALGFTLISMEMII